MVSFQKKKLGDGSLHVAIIGKIDEQFDGATVVDEPASVPVVMDLAGVRAISSLGVRAFENFVAALAGRELVLVDISPAIASQVAMIPNLVSGARIESAKLPFVCPACGAESAHSIPYAVNATVEHAPRCTCGARMMLDGLPEQYLPCN
jgi:anti-anti-sigma regulatory factor